GVARQRVACVDPCADHALIQRTGYAVARRGGDVGVTEQFLDGAIVVAGLEEMGREGVTESVAGDWFAQACGLGGGAEAALHDRLVQMVAPKLTGSGIAMLAGGGEYPLPRPLAMRVRVLRGEALGQGHVARACDDVGVVLDLDVTKVVCERLSYAVGEHGATVPSTFAAVNGDPASFEFDVLDAQLGAFEQPKTRPVHEHRHQLRRAVHLRQDGLDL